MAIGKVDVAVIGAGIFGLSVAEACLSRGMTVTVVESDRIGAGASGGVVGALSPHVPEQWNAKKAYQLRALLEAEAYWARIGGSGYRRTRRLLPLRSAEERARAEGRAQGAAELWEGRADWSVIDTGSEGWLAPEVAPFGMVQETLSARIFPPKALASLARVIRASGGQILEGWTVETVETGRITGPQGEIAATHIVVAAGVRGFALLEPALGERAGTGVKGQAALLAADSTGAEPLIYHDGLYIVPHGGNRVAVGSTSETVWLAPYTTDAALDDVIARARQFCPRLRDAEVLTRWAGLRPKARRRDPMLGPVPSAPNLFAAMGGFKIGFGLAPAVGETLADLVEGKATELPESFQVGHHLKR